MLPGEIAATELACGCPIGEGGGCSAPSVAIGELARVGRGMDCPQAVRAVPINAAATRKAKLEPGMHFGGGDDSMGVWKL